MIPIRIAGVPEHFNLPWHLAIERGLFKAQGIDLQWTDYPGGTGAMCQDLEADKVDLALLLTEGAVAAISKGNPSKLVQFYVESPLIWGIHTGHDSKIKTIEDLEGGVYAISRYGSGSHLMAFVDAKNRSWSTDNLRFEVIGNLEGAKQSLSANKTDGFMWEKFTTKPLVDDGTFRRIGECPTPWPCFVLVASDRFLEKHAAELVKIQAIINSVAEEVQANEAMIPTFADRYGLQTDDVKAWFAQTRWATSPVIEQSTIEGVQDTLLELGLLEEKLPVSSLLH